MKHYLCFVSYVFSIHILVSLVCNGGLGVGREKMAEKIEKERQPRCDSPFIELIAFMGSMFVLGIKVLTRNEHSEHNVQFF